MIIARHDCALNSSVTFCKLWGTEIRWITRMTIVRHDCSCLIIAAGLPGCCTQTGKGLSLSGLAAGIKKGRLGQTNKP